jgi:vacuolar-type H+-ATPase subunit I/STV1
MQGKSKAGGGGAAHKRVSSIGTGVTAIITATCAVIGVMDASTTRNWLSFSLTIGVVILALGLLPGLRAWTTVPWVSLVAVMVIGGGFAFASDEIGAAGAFLFVITTATHEARARGSAGTGR